MTPPTDYRDKAAQCRRLAKDVTNRDVAGRLLDLAAEYDAEAKTAESRAGGRPPEPKAFK